MWYRVKFFLKVQLDKIYSFIVVRVICVYDFRAEEIEQACQAVTYVSEAMYSCISLLVTNLSMVLQTTEVRLMGL